MKIAFWIIILLVLIGFTIYGDYLLFHAMLEVRNAGV